MSNFNLDPINFKPDRVPSTSGTMPSLTAPVLNGKRPRRMRSATGAAHYGNGHNGKKGPAANKSKAEYHDRKNAAPIFLQSKSKLFLWFELDQSCVLAIDTNI